MKSIVCHMLVLSMAIHLGAAEQPHQAADAQQIAKVTKLIQNLEFIHLGDMKAGDFMRAHPCMTGSWEGVKETDTHWIGRLYYPSDNTKDGSAYMTADFKIKKDAEIKIDLSKWKGRLILLMPKPDSRDEDQIGHAEFTLIDHSKHEDLLNDGIWELHKLFPYKPK